jgi:hypothetical protein
VKVPHLTVGPNVRRGCEPVHMGGCKYLRSTAQMCKVSSPSWVKSLVLTLVRRHPVCPVNGQSQDRRACLKSAKLRIVVCKTGAC